MFLDFEKMVAEIQHCKAALLSKQYNDHAASPVEPISKTLPVSTKQPTEWTERQTHGSVSREQGRTTSTPLSTQILRQENDEDKQFPKFR